MQRETCVFGSFELRPKERLLLDNGRTAKLGSRALDILVALVEAAGETVSNTELRSRAWPTTNVDEASLRVHISALRKTLGHGQSNNHFIVNVPGLGYRFVGPIARGHSHSVAVTQDVRFTHNQPLSLPSVIGRAEAIVSLAGHLARRRLVTIVGPGGVGKTTLAIATATAAKDSFRDGIWFAALDSADRPESIASTIGATLGVAEDGVEPMLDWLGNKQALVVLDNCEHVIDAAAAMAETILRAAPQVSVLATSREPLRAEGELSYRLKPLETPPLRHDTTVDEAQAYAAVQLFAERAQACCSDFVLNDTNAPAICEICYELDGLPLALELAGAQVGFMGVQGLALILDNRLASLTCGRRTALQRQQNLRSTMDWSYSLLSETEKIILRRIAIFAGHFTMEAASAVASDERISGTDAIKGVVSLVTKSMIATDVVDDVAYLHLLKTTRVYALEKLADSREGQRLGLRRAEYYDQLLRSAGARRRGVPSPGRESNALYHGVPGSSDWWPASNAAGETPTSRHSIAECAKAARFEQSSLMANV